MAKNDSAFFYLIHYRDPKDGKIIALKAKRIEDSTLGLAFVKISDFIFETESVVVQPTELQLQQRFENVLGLHLSIYSIVSVEEIGALKATDKATDRRGNGRAPGLKFKKPKSNLLSFPDPSTPNSTK